MPAPLFTRLSGCWRLLSALISHFFPSELPSTQLLSRLYLARNTPGGVGCGLGAARVHFLLDHGMSPRVLVWIDLPEGRTVIVQNSHATPPIWVQIQSQHLLDV